MFMGWNGEFHFLWRWLGLGSCPSVPSIPRIQCLGIVAASLQGSYRDETESTEAPRKKPPQDAPMWLYRPPRLWGDKKQNG